MIEITLILLFTLMGILLGTITGLIPGLHVNTVALILLSLSSSSIAFFNIFQNHISESFIFILISSTIIGTLITHTFIDFIPSTFFGAPDEDTALSVLPSHELLLEGKGFEAIDLSVRGSIGAILICFIILIPLKFIFGEPFNLYPILTKYMVYILLTISFLLIVSEHRNMKYPNKTKNGYELSSSTFSRTIGVLFAAFLFFLSGIFGLLIFEMSTTSPFALPSTFLFPALSGLFGLSTLLFSLQCHPEIPKQIINKVTYDNKKSLESIIIGSFSGLFVGFLPGVSSGTATVLGTIGKSENKDAKSIIVMLGSINTSNAFFCLIALFLILRQRNGATVVINQLIPIQEWTVLLPPIALAYLLISVLISAIISYFLTLYLGKFFSVNIHKFNYKKLVFSISITIIIMVFIFTGLLGLLILGIATSIGLIAPFFGVRRSHCMGVLLLPIMVRLL